jgi:hypothetical protein
MVRAQSTHAFSADAERERGGSVRGTPPRARSGAAPSIDATVASRAP